MTEGAKKVPTESEKTQPDAYGAPFASLVSGSRRGMGGKTSSPFLFADFLLLDFRVADSRAMSVYHT